VDRDFLEEITAAFVRATGRGLMLSPKDHGLVVRWYRAEIPKEVVIRGIEQAFETAPSRRVRSLAYVSPSVEKAARAYREKRVGSALSVERDEKSASVEIDGFVDKINQLVSESASRVYVPVLQSLRLELLDLGRNCDRDMAFQIGERLEELENKALDACMSCMSDEQRHSIETDVRLALDKMPRLDPVTQTETEQAFIRRAVRKQVGLPALQIRLGGGW